MTKEDYLRSLMKKKFGSVKAFSEHINMPYTTVHSILDRGVDKAAISNVIEITKALNIPIELLERDEIDFLDSIDIMENETISEIKKMLPKLNNKNQEKVLEYTKERLILQEAETK